MSGAPLRHAAPLPGAAYLWVVGAAVLLRTIWALLIDVHPVSDSQAYESFARTLAAHGTFGWEASRPFAFWPPGTSALYALSLKMFGGTHAPIVAVHVLLGGAVVGLSMLLSDRWFGARAAIASGIVLAAWPTLVMFSTILASELPFLVLVLLAHERWTNTSSSVAARALWSGMFLGLAALVRPVALPMPAIFAASALMAGGWPALRSPRAYWKHALMAALAFVAMAVVVAPWTWRNFQVYGEFIPVSTNGGITFWMGNTPGTDGGYARVPAWAAALPDNEQARALSAEAKKYIAAQPGAFVVRTLRKAVRLFGYESIGVTWNEQGIQDRLGAPAVRALKLFTHASWFVILALAAAGIFALLRGAAGVPAALAAWPCVTIAFLTVVHSITVSQDRYHLSFAPQMAMLAGLGALHLARRIGRRQPALT